MIVWPVSHCKTEGKRENYVAELKKFITVDIYGKCGDNACANNVQRAHCFLKFKKKTERPFLQVVSRTEGLCLVRNLLSTISKK